MLAWFQRLRPRRLILVGAILLGLSGSLAIVLDQMRPLSHREWDDLSTKYNLRDYGVGHSQRVRRMIEEEGLGINGWHLHWRWHRAYTKLDVAGFLAGLTLVGYGALAARRARAHRLGSPL